LVGDGIVVFVVVFVSIFLLLSCFVVIINIIRFL